MKRKLALLSIVVLSLLSITVIQASAAITPGTKCSKAGLQSVYKFKIYTCIKLGSQLFWDNGVTFYLSKPSPSPAPTVTVIATPSPAPTVTITASPAPAPTVTVTAKPSPAPTVTITASPKALPASLPAVTSFYASIGGSFLSFSFNKPVTTSKITNYELAAQYLLNPNSAMNSYSSYSELKVIRSIYSTSFDVWLSEIQEFLTGNDILTKDRSVMFRLRAINNDVSASPWSTGLYFTPSQIWGSASATPSPTPTKTVTPAPTPSPTPTSTSTKISSKDIQFIYGTTNECNGHIGFIRFDPSGSLIVDRKIVETNDKFEIRPLDYNEDELLFSTKNCNSYGKVGSIETIWRLNLSNPNSTPKEVYKLTNQGPRNGVLLDAQIDIASNKVLVFAWVDGDQQIFTAETRPLVIWSLQKQGWLSAGIYGTEFRVSTGWSLSVYAYNSQASTWRSAYVDWRTEIPGLGSVTPRGYGSNAQFEGRGSVQQVTSGILNMPYVFSSDEGLFACIDFPTTSGAIVKVDLSTRCTRISGYQIGQVAMTFADSGTGKSAQGVVSVRDGKVYIFESGPLFGDWNPIRIVRTVDIATTLRSLPSMFYIVSTFEVINDLNLTSPKLKYSGFFSNL